MNITLNFNMRPYGPVQVVATVEGGEVKDLGIEYQTPKQVRNYRTGYLMPMPGITATEEELLKDSVLQEYHKQYPTGYHLRS
ncbi:MAG: hypothetical protein LCH81_03530 [Bacteroidetes bacterium]|nr:hypothetical protein [Bacteroidota bacterium]